MHAAESFVCDASPAGCDTLGVPQSSHYNGRQRAAPECLMSEEKRTFDRIETEHSIRILCEDGSSFPGIAANISLTGLQIVCDKPTLERITPHGVATKADHQVPIRVKVNLPDMPEAESKLGLFGQIMSVRTSEEDEYRIGVRFTDFEPGSYNALEHYLDSHL